MGGFGLFTILVVTICSKIVLSENTITKALRINLHQVSFIFTIVLKEKILSV